MLLIKRIVAYIVDFFVILIPIMVLCLTIGTLLFIDTEGDYNLLPIMIFVYAPHAFWITFFSDPTQYFTWLPFVLFAVVIFESLAYSIQVRFFGNTLGNKLMRLKIVSNEGCLPQFLRLFVWNMLKVFSRHILLFPISLLSHMLSKEKATFYDFFLGVKVREKTPKLSQ